MPINSTSTLQFKATLNDSRPPIWRRFTIPADKTLLDLHDVLQVLFGWEDYHLHEFRIGRKNYGIPDPDEHFEDEILDDSNFTLFQVLEKEGQRFPYLYDFGDGWQIDLVIEKVQESSAKDRKAVCLAGARNGPPEDVGGVYGYEEFLEAIADPAHEMYADLLQWIGGHFDSEEFDIQAINKSLGRIGKPIDYWEVDPNPEAENHFGYKTSWITSGSKKFNKTIQDLPLRRDIVEMLTYIQNNKVVGTATTGNFPLKTVEEMVKRFVDPIKVWFPNGERRYRSELEVDTLYFYHVLAIAGQLLTGGKGRKWRLTELGHRFLAESPAWQYWHLLITFWTQTNWLSVAHVYVPEEEISTPFKILLLFVCQKLSPTYGVSFERFVENLAENSYIAWQSLYFSEYKEDLVEQICINPLISFGIFQPDYELRKHKSFSRKHLNRITITQLGASVLKAFMESIEKASPA